VAVPAVAGTVSLWSVGDATAGLGQLSESPKKPLSSLSAGRLEQHLDKSLDLG
jgi:hypothetical protein